MWSNTYEIMSQLAQVAWNIDQGINGGEGKAVLNTTYISGSLRAEKPVEAYGGDTEVSYF